MPSFSFTRIAARLAALLAALAALVFTPVGTLAGEALPDPGLTDAERAFIEAHPVVTFSDSIWEPLSMVENGKVQGIFHDFYEIVSAMTGLAFKFEPQGDSRDFGKVLAALREKRIDMIDGTGRTPDREKYALFAGPYLRFPMAIVSRDDAMAATLFDLRGKKVAVASGSTAYEYARDSHADLDLVVVEDHSAALVAVSSGQAQAMIDNLAVVTYGIRRLGLSNLKVSGLTDYVFDIYALVRDDMPELASILDKALKAIPVWDKAAIMAKWLPVYASGQAVSRAEGVEQAATPGAPAAPARVVLNRREREYVTAKGTLRFCVDPDWPPVERIDQAGRYEGMAADVMNLLSQRLSVDIQLVPTATWAQSLETVKKGGCDFIAAAADTPERREFLDFTSPYLRLPLVVAARSGHPFVDGPKALERDRVGVVAGHATGTLLRAKYPSLHLVDVAGDAAGLEQVAEGGLDAFADALPVLAYRLGNDRLTGLKIAGRLDEDLDLCVAVPKGRTEVFTIFQKGVNSLSAAEVEAIFKKWVSVRFEHGFDYTLVWRVAAGAALVLVVIVWWNRKLSRLNRTIRQAHEELAALLDNSGQGFLSFRSDGLVQPGYSRECRDIFGRDPAGEDIAGLLFPGDPRARDDFAKNTGRVLKEPDAFRRSLYLSLMPKAVHLEGRVLEVEYRELGPDRLMLVLTDVTDARRLENEVEKERARLANVVAVARDPRDFFQVTESFRRFTDACRKKPAGEGDAAESLRRLYRKVHTFKGLFQIFGCCRVSEALHALESRLSGLDGPVTAPALAEAMCLEPVGRALAEDMETLRRTLGDDFFKRRGGVCIDADAAREFQQLAEGLAGVLDAALPGPDPRVRRLVEKARTLRHVDMRELLAVPLGTASRLAGRLGKVVHTPPVAGEAVPVDPDRFGPLARRVVHLVRNAVAHGIETPEARVRAGKPEAGTVTLSVDREGDALVVRVSDDGAGIRPEAIRRRAAELGLADADRLAAMDDRAVSRLVLAQGLSTAGQADETSGRGVGLAAVMEEVQRLGGDMIIESDPGRGTTFSLRVPLAAADRAKEQA